jgi:hypothetical protein
MINLQPPSQPRVPVGTIKLPNGTTFEVVLNDEWARYFNSLNNQVVDTARSVAEAVQHAQQAQDGGEWGETMPGPPGPRGFIGEPGASLFMLADGGDDATMMYPPAIDNVYVPLASKDAPNGVPGLTELKLNLKNAAGTVVNFFTTLSTVARTWTMPNKDGTVAVLADFGSPPAIGDVAPASGKFTTFGCNGAAPQGAVASGGTVAGTAATNASPYGFTTAAQANAVVSKLNIVIDALRANGTLT